MLAYQFGVEANSHRHPKIPRFWHPINPLAGVGHVVCGGAVVNHIQVGKGDVGPGHSRPEPAVINAHNARGWRRIAGRSHLTLHRPVAQQPVAVEFVGEVGVVAIRAVGVVL